MYSVYLAMLSATIGQPGPPGGPPGGMLPPGPAPWVQAGGAVVPGIPNGLPALQPAAGQVVQTEQVPQITIVAPPPPAPPAPAPAPAPAPPDRWALMRVLQGSWYGAQLEDSRTTISGWTEGSYTASTANISNQPVVWNDRANRFLMNQTWIRIERSTVTSGTYEPTWGYRIDADYGSDYRFSLMRGLLNNQLLNSLGNQNLYGIDLIQFYGNAYIPTLFQGTDIRAGRLFTPWGYESLEGVSTPFVSRSYAFNWSPPFTHMGIMVSPTFNAQWSGKFMLANGNDVFIGDPAEEMRSVGAITWNSLDKTDTVTYGWTWGRGKFNAGDRFSPATAGEQSEPAGRNNLNVNDLVWTHIFNPKLSYATELLYGYQTNVPANVPGGIIALNRTEGTAHWGSTVHYLNYAFTNRVTGIVRFEMFDDFEGQRTGFEGLYTAITAGAQIRPTKSTLIRPELRYDHNGYSTPFEGKHGIFTAAMDFIVRW